MKAVLCAPLLACAVLLASAAYAASSSATPMKGSHSTNLLTLEGLGEPKISPGCDLYRTRAHGAHLAVGNTLFTSGFQLSNIAYPLTQANGSVEIPCGGTANYAWTFTHKHSRFAALLALDASNKAHGPIVRFLDYFATPIPFRYHGKLILSLQLQKNGTYPIALDLTGVTGLTISLTRADRHPSIVDVIADHIS